MWNLRDIDEMQVKQAMKKLKISEVLARILLSRGVGLKEAALLLRNPMALIGDPSKIINAQRAADAILRFAKRPDGEIWIFADYDVDGMTSGFVLADFLRNLKEKTYVYYPERSEQYGMSMTFCREMAQRKTRIGEDILVLTVDNGVTCLEQVAFLNTHSIETVVLDHHEMKGALPDCIVCNPRIEAESGGRDLAGVGVVWQVCRLIEESCDFAVADQYLYAVAIGTIADVMPMTLENMGIVMLGMRQINGPQCPRALELFKQKYDKKELYPVDIAWDIVPKLNACGRMGETAKGAALFFSDAADETCVTDLLLEIFDIDEQRRRYTRDAEKEIAGLDFSQKAACVFRADQYPSGIVGILAGKIAEKFHKPAFVVYGEDILHGSARGTCGINLLKILENEKKQGHILDYGGHEGACGFSLRSDQLTSLQKSLNESVCAIEGNDAVETAEDLLLDAAIDFKDLSARVFKELHRFPYDKQDFPAPLLLLSDMEVIKAQPSRSNPANVCFTLQDAAGKEKKIWAWNLAAEYETLGRPARIDLAGSVERDFRNSKAYTFKIVRMRVPDGANRPVC